MAIALLACSSTSRVVRDHKFYTTDSDGCAIRREGERISCQHPHFEDFICLRKADFQCYYAEQVLGESCTEEQ
jgi:hypothetical protein